MPGEEGISSSALKHLFSDLTFSKDTQASRNQADDSGASGYRSSRRNFIFAIRYNLNVQYPRRNTTVSVLKVECVVHPLGSLKMAKKKAATPKANKAPAQSASKAKAKKSPPAQSNSSDRNCSSGDIGQVAGEIWHRLDSCGHQSISQLKKSISAPPDVIMAAVGWLAREDKVQFEKSGRSTKVGLR